MSELGRFLGDRNVGGIYMPRYTGSIAFTTRSSGRVESRGGQPLSLTPEIVLFHEYTHHFLNNNFAFGAPLWFSEGFPEFWSTIRFHDDGRIQFGIPALHRAGELMSASAMHVRRLLTIRYPIRSNETLSVVYGRGWLLSHFLFFQPDRRGQLNAYLRAISEGRSAEEAAEVFGDLDRMNTEMIRYLGQRQMNIVTIAANQAPRPEVTIRQVTPAEEAIMRVRMRSKRGVDAREAQRVVVEARRVAAPFPNDAAAQVMLAEAEFDAGNYAEAEAAAARAIAANPRLIEAHLYKSRAMQEQLKNAADATPAQWRAARAPITAANRLDPEDPEPLVAYYDSFRSEGVSPPATAISGLIYAQVLAPEDRSLRLLAGRELLAANRGDEARRVLLPITGDSHAGALGTMVAEVLATLAQGGAAAALARLEQGSTRD